MAAERAPSATGAARVLVTGATGTLGRHVVAALEARRAVGVRVLSRREPPPDTPAHRAWATADLTTDPLEAAVEGVDAVIHLASTKGAGDGDVIGIRRLVDAAERASVRHLVVISIIGCDRIPLPFYATKLQIEAVTRAARVPWSIVRVAQFHSFVDRLVATPASLPLPSPIIADLRFQPVDEREVAERLVEVALGQPRGDAPEMAGPEVLTLVEIAAVWLAESGRAASLVPVPLEAVLGASSAAPPASVAAILEGYRAAENTPHGDRTLGRVRFADWLRQRRDAGQARGHTSGRS